MEYDTLLLRMIPGDFLSAFPHRQFHTLSGLLGSGAALPNSYPNALRAMQGGSLYHFYDGLWYDPTERRTHDLPCDRRTRYRRSQPDTALCWRNRYVHKHRNNTDSQIYHEAAVVCVEGRGMISRSGLTQDIKMRRCVTQCDIPLR